VVFYSAPLLAFFCGPTAAQQSLSLRLMEGDWPCGATDIYTNKQKTNIIPIPYKFQGTCGGKGTTGCRPTPLPGGAGIVSTAVAIALSRGGLSGPGRKMPRYSRCWRVVT